MLKCRECGKELKLGDKVSYYVNYVMCWDHNEFENSKHYLSAANVTYYKERERFNNEIRRNKKV